MRPCPKCGAAIANDATKCEDCGETFESDASTTSEPIEVQPTGSEPSSPGEYSPPPPVRLFRMGLFTALVVVWPCIAFSIGGTAVAFAAWFVGLLAFFAVEQLTH